MSYAEAVRFASVQPFPLQPRLLLSLFRICPLTSPVFPRRSRLAPANSFTTYHIHGPSALLPRPSALFTIFFSSPSQPTKIARLFRCTYTHFSGRIDRKEVRNIATTTKVSSSNGIFNAPREIICSGNFHLA